MQECKKWAEEYFSNWNWWERYLKWWKMIVFYCYLKPSNKILKEYLISAKAVARLVSFSFQLSAHI